MTRYRSISKFCVLKHTITVVAIVLASQTCHRSHVVAGLGVSHSPNISGTGSYPCFNHADDGYLEITCRVEVSSSFALAILLRIQRGIHADTWFMYVERRDNLTYCRNKYVVVDSDEEVCNVVFWDTQLHINYHGNINVSFSAILPDQSLPKCIETEIENIPESNMNMTRYCYGKGYNNTLTCVRQNDQICRFDFSSDCNVSFGNREASFQCSDTSSVTQNQTIMLIYPTHFSVLDLTDSNIIHLGMNSFTYLNNLQELDIEYNHIRTLDARVFMGLNNLTYLSLKANSLITLDALLFHGLKRLTLLNLSQNQLGKLPVSLFYVLENLNELYLYTNQLEQLHAGLFDRLHNLIVLDLYYNQLNTLDKDLFHELQNLSILYLSDNKLTSLPGTLLYGLENLKELHLYTNQLEQLDADFFDGLHNLFLLDLDYNQINTLDKDLFNHLQNLSVLYLSGNKLTSLPVTLFHNLENLNQLHLDTNKLKRLDANLFQGLEKLTFLTLRANQLSTVNPAVFHGLNNVITDRSIGLNTLNTLPDHRINDLVSLTHLFLYDNQLVSLNPYLFHGLQNLRLLSLFKNRLVELNADIFRGLYNLKELFLDRNRLIKLDAGIFQSLKNLNILYLQKNKLTELDTAMFKETNKITILDLSKNMLRNIPNVNHLTHLLFLNLRGNPMTMINSDTFSILTESVELFVSQHEVCECYVSDNVICSAASVRSPYLTCDRLLSDGALVAIMWLIGLNALVGNIFVLAWRNKPTNKSKVQSILLRHLAMSDLLMGIYMLIIAVADIYFGMDFSMQAETWRSSITCKIAGTMAILSSEASVFFVTLISIDRLICIRFPYSTKSLKVRSTNVAAAVIWILSFLLGVVPSVLAGVNYAFYDISHVCIGLPLAVNEMYFTKESTEQIYHELFYYNKTTFTSHSNGRVTGMYFSTVLFLGLNCICYLIIVACYTEIIRTVHKSSKRAGLNREMKEQVRMTVKIAAIVVTDFFCWFPIILLGILVQTGSLVLPPSVFAWSVTVILPINSAINPYLYTIATIINTRGLTRVQATQRAAQQSDISRQTRNTQMLPPGTVANALDPSGSHVNEFMPHVPIEYETADSNI